MRADGPPPLVQARRLLPIAELEDLGGAQRHFARPVAAPVGLLHAAGNGARSNGIMPPPSCRVAGVQRLMALRAARHRLEKRLGTLLAGAVEAGSSHHETLLGTFAVLLARAV